MERRFFLALVLSGLVLVVTPMLFPPRPRPGAAAPAAAAPVALGAPGSAGARPALPRAGARAIAPVARAETVTVRTGMSAYAFSTLGAAPIAVNLQDYRALHGAGGTVVLRRDGEPLLRYQVVGARDTIALDRIAYAAARAAAPDGSATLTFRGASGEASASITYRVAAEGYLSSVSVSVTDVPAPAFLLVDLPTGFDSQEADTAEDFRHLAYSVKPVTRRARGIGFGSLDPGERRLEAGPLSWAVAKNKYFLIGLLADTLSPFAEAHVVGGLRDAKMATRAQARVVVPLVSGAARFELYAGPQSWPRLHAIGREFETANPYGGFMQPVVQPFATIVMRVMLWLKRVVRLDYGWVLVIFGVAVRILMWPLNQSAMRSSLRLQRVQPELQAVQARYKGDPAKQQQEILRVYREHGMSPFSAFSGCLPALIPMPVFFALFFVFQNTIEFRGVPFLWLTDISLRDPLYVLPLLTGASMFVMSWIGMRGMPSTPQTQMMLYLMPVMFVVFLLNTASGLSIYYLVQNLAAIPQQWLIANERAKAGPAGAKAVERPKPES
jgi:YidC/Oxa1 family membrane protein insertase